MTPEEKSQLDSLSKIVSDLQQNAVMQGDFRQLQNQVNQNSFSTVSIFNVPVRVSAPISPQAGGKVGLYIGSGAFGIYYGSGAPTVVASKGSLYMRSDASGTANRLYVNTNGSSTWTNFTSAA